MQLVDGPFRELHGGWEFAALGDDGCKVSLALDFDYAGGLMAPIMRAGFEKLADRMVDEFCREAERDICLSRARSSVEVAYADLQRADPAQSGNCGKFQRG